jgi:hypothetical protein
MIAEKYDRLNFLQKAVVRHAHPVSFILNILGLLWGGFFLWSHQVLWAVLCLVLAPTIGHLVGLKDRSYLLMARSQLNTFQKLLIYHADLRNLLFHVIALGLFLWGAWSHAPLILLGAFSFVLLGHMFPWWKHKREEQLFALMVDEDL